MKTLKGLKGFPKLFIQILVLGISMIVFSFLTETDFWNEYFCYIHQVQKCGLNGIKGIHLHWNYRGWVYILMCTAFLGVSIAKIVMSHKEEDFKNKQTHERNSNNT